MKQSCPNCHTILEINENDYTPGEIVSKECPLCEEKIEFVIPIHVKEENETDSTTNSEEQGQNKSTPKKVVRVRATEAEKRLAKAQKQEKLQRTEPVKKKDETKGNNLATIISILVVLLLAGVGFFIYQHITKNDENEYADNYIVQGPIDYQGYMDWENGITLRLSETANGIEGVYNNNAYPGTFLDVKGTKSGSHYDLTLFRGNGSEMGKFTLIQTGKKILGNYYDNPSGTDHRVEITSDVSNPIQYQTNPSKVEDIYAEDEGRQMIIDFYTHYIFAQDSEHPLTYYCMPALIKEATYEHPEFGEVVNISRFAGNTPEGVDLEHLISVTNDGNQWYTVTYSAYGDTFSTRVLVTRYKNRFMIEKTIPHYESDSQIDNIEKAFQRDTNGHSYVDLGLPSGVCWATSNLGADNSSDIGDHFAWGETSKKYEYTQNSYNLSLGNNTLSLGNDAAASQWGGTWRTPTKDEWQELINNCHWSWNETGYRVTGKNGNSIFLPAAGYSKGSSRFKEGERGDYWTSSPVGSNKAYEFVIKSDVHNIESDSRFYGLSIRPVTN